MKTLIIAEAGVNHNGDMHLARQLIDVAADAGADMVKFQTFKADLLATSQAQKAEYQTKNTKDVSESQYQMLKRLELTPEMHRELMTHCVSRGIEFFSTAFDLDSLDFLVELGLKQFKIPSGEITNFPYLNRIGRYKMPVILSTGMATLEEVAAALGVLKQAGTPCELITVLHCTTEYPTPMTDVNLRAMCTLRDEFGVKVGYSDHTQGIEVAIAAVALGATVIEKHFTLDRRLPGPDHQASLEPGELKTMIQAIRNVETALGDGVKQPSAIELKNKSVARKSLVASRKICAGEAFTEDNIMAKRPGTGVSPMRWNEVMGLKAPRDFSPEELIEL